MFKIAIFLLLLALPKDLKIPPLDIQNFLRVVITAYSPEPAQTDSTPYITATNTRVREGIVAVSRELEKVFPMGSTIEIEGKLYLVADRMSKRWKGYRADIFFWDKKEALKFGKKEVVINYK